MGAVDKKLSRYKHFFDRIVEIYRFIPFDFEDVTTIINTLSDVPFEDSDIEVLTECSKFEVTEMLELLVHKNKSKESDCTSVYLLYKSTPVVPYCTHMSVTSWF